MTDRARPDDHASFEPGAVLPPKRARGARLALLVPVVALIGVAWAGLSGAPAELTAAASPRPTTVPVPSVRAEPRFPAELVGLKVQRLSELQLGGVGRDTVVALAGWFVPAVISDCPSFTTIFRRGSMRASCVRSGVLYPSRPGIPTDRSPDVIPAGVAVEFVVGVTVPRELEASGSGPTEVVVVGRFSKSSDGCRTGIGCSRELVVDHVTWISGA